MMKCCSKEQIDRTGRATKTSMDLSHVCPSKLSKKELEEFYYALLQENLEMKKSFNKQNEQLKILSTKLQRMMTTQRTYMANEPKDCCSSTKAMVQDQKKTIADLKKANDNLKLEIKNLNMKLCSARQFLKRSSQGPYQMQNKSVSRPTSSIVGPTDSTRNSSTSALNLKKPEIVDDQMKSVSCQCLVKLGLPSGDIEKLCDENRCRTQMDELKQKIVNLQEELHKTHEEYAKRISKLEHEVTDLQEENARVRNERAATDVTLDKRVSEVNDMKKKLRDTQTECEFLNTELTIEKGKVAELEAQVKAAAIGTPLLKAIEYRLSKDPTNNKLKDDASSLAVKDTKLSLDPRSAAGTTPTKKADDSGYGEANQSNDNDDKEAMQKLNQELMDQIADLQRQLSELKTRMLSNSDTYTIESDDALKDSGDTNATSGPKNGDLKPRDKKETDKDLKDVNQRLYDGDPSNADCEKICRLETNQDCSDNCLNKPSNESGNKPKTPNNFENEPDSKEYQPLNTNNESKNIRESRNKDNDNKYQIPGPIPVTSTPVGRKPDVTYAMLTKRDNDTESLNLPKIEDSLVINRENIIHKRLENKEEIPTTLRLRNKIKEATEKHKSSLAKDTFYYNDPAGNEQLLASNLQNEAQTLKKSPPDVSSQNVEENYPNDQRLNQFSQEKPQHDHNKPQHEKTAPVSKRTPSHIHDIIQSLYARFAKKTSSQAQTEGISANGQNIEDPQTTGTAPKLEDTPPKVETNIGPHKCTCKMENPDSVARNTTPKIADCPKCCKELTAEMTSNDTEGPKCCKNPTSAPLTDNPANEIIKPPNTDNTTVTFDKNYEDDNKSLALNDYLNNQNSDPDRIKNDVGSQDGPEYQGNQSRRKSSAGMQVPVLERKFDDVGATRAPPPPEKDEAVVLLPPMRPPSSSYQGLVDDTYIQPKDEHTQLSKEDKAIDNQLDICEHMTHVCTCPQESPAVVGPARKDVAVFRTCSGTLRFRTTDTPTSHIRKCRCSGKSKHPHCGAPEGQTVDSVTHTHNEEGVQAIEHPWNGNTSAPRTYTINAFAELVKCSRATSPENTDQEISSMTDLPSEKDTTSSPRCKKCETWTSPGEDKATTTTTSHSHTMPTAYSLSEGELPQLDKPTRDQCSEAAYAPKSVRKISAKNNLLENSSSAQMEAALQAIGNELARCRQLLLQSREPEEIPTNQNSKPVPKPVKEASVMAGASSPHLPASPPPSLASTLPLRLTESPPQSITSTLPFDPSPLPPPHVSRPIQDFIPSPPPPALYPMLETKQGSIISLRKTEARPRIGDAYTPRAMFTLHIGTVVLSDEAVINSRDLSLVLTWQFYDQNVAMSRMRSGRVVHFDFSTEYDLKLTDTFLNYLKADELHIKICEVNKLDETLASCSLPLREALLHTNRRVDMSLALVAGPQMRWSPPTADALDSGDEMGVLDLWCMLRAEPRLLPRINKAIAHTRASSSPGGRHLPSSGAIMMQINEDDQDDIRLSGDLSFNPTSTRNSMVGPVQDDRRNSKADKGVQTQDIDTRRNDSGQEKRSNFGYRDSSQPFPPYPGASDMGNIKPGEKLSAEINSTDIKHPPNSMEELKNQVSFENRWNAFESRRRSSGIIINEVPANVTTSTKMKEALEKNLRKPAIEEYDVDEKRDSGQLSIKSLVRRPKNMSMEKRDLLSMATRASGNSFDDFLNNTNYDDKNIIKRSDMEPTRERHTSDTTELSRKYDNMSKMMGAKKAMEAFKRVKIKKDESFIAPTTQENYDKPTDYLDRIRSQSIDITILWLALNEECAAMGDPGVQRLYVAYTFIGRGGAELETPLSLPKPKQSQDKCYFNFKKSFQLKESDLPILGRMAKCRSPNKGPPDANDCVVFTVVSEPVEDPLGLNNCEDIGNAHLFFGDLLAYSAGSDTYTEVIPVRGTRLDDVCGVLAIRVDGLDVVRKCLMLASVSEQRQPFVSF